MYSAVSFVGDGHDHVDGGGEGNASDRVQEVRVDHLQNAFPNAKPEIKFAYLRYIPQRNRLLNLFYFSEKVCQVPKGFYGCITFSPNTFYPVTNSPVTFSPVTFSPM